MGSRQQSTSYITMNHSSQSLTDCSGSVLSQTMAPNNQYHNAQIRQKNHPHMKLKQQPSSDSTESAAPTHVQNNDNVFVNDSAKDKFVEVLESSVCYSNVDSHSKNAIDSTPLGKFSVDVPTVSTETTVTTKNRITHILENPIPVVQLGNRAEEIRDHVNESPMSWKSNIFPTNSTNVAGLANTITHIEENLVPKVGTANPFEHNTHVNETDVQVWRSPYINSKDNHVKDIVVANSSHFDSNFASQSFRQTDDSKNLDLANSKVNASVDNIVSTEPNLHPIEKPNISKLGKENATTMNVSKDVNCDVIDLTSDTSSVDMGTGESDQMKIADLDNKVESPNVPLVAESDQHDEYDVLNREKRSLEFETQTCQKKHKLEQQSLTPLSPKNTDQSETISPLHVSPAATTMRQTITSVPAAKNQRSVATLKATPTSANARNIISITRFIGTELRREMYRDDSHFLTTNFMTTQKSSEKTRRLVLKKRKRHDVLFDIVYYPTLCSSRTGFLVGTQEFLDSVQPKEILSSQSLNRDATLVDDWIESNEVDQNQLVSMERPRRTTTRSNTYKAKTSRVGSKYQAVIKYHPNTYNRSTDQSIHTDGTVIWDPYQAASKLGERDREFLEKKDVELNAKYLLMESLHRAGYNARKAMPIFFSLYQESQSRFTEMSENEKKRFVEEIAPNLLGIKKDFSAAAKAMDRTKETMMVHYYLWKRQQKDYAKLKLERRSEPDFCSVCQDGGILIVCDLCRRAFHMACCTPPLTSIPKGDWYCARCVNASPARLRRLEISNRSDFDGIEDGKNENYDEQFEAPEHDKKSIIRSVQKELLLTPSKLEKVATQSRRSSLTASTYLPCGMTWDGCSEAWNPLENSRNRTGTLRKNQTPSTSAAHKSPDTCSPIPESTSTSPDSAYTKYAQVDTAFRKAKSSAADSDSYSSKSKDVVELSSDSSFKVSQTDNEDSDDDDVLHKKTSSTSKPNSAKNTTTDMQATTSLKESRKSDQSETMFVLYDTQVPITTEGLLLNISSHPHGGTCFTGYRPTSSNTKGPAEVMQSFRASGDRFIMVDGRSCVGKSFDEVRAMLKEVRSGQHCKLLRMENRIRKKDYARQGFPQRSTAPVVDNQTTFRSNPNPTNNAHNNSYIKSVHPVANTYPINPCQGHIPFSTDQQNASPLKQQIQQQPRLHQLQNHHQHHYQQQAVTTQQQQIVPGTFHVGGSIPAQQQQQFVQPPAHHQQQQFVQPLAHHQQQQFVQPIGHQQQQQPILHQQQQPHHQPHPQQLHQQQYHHHQQQQQVQHVSQQDFTPPHTIQRQNGPQQHTVSAQQHPQQQPTSPPPPAVVVAPTNPYPNSNHTAPLVQQQQQQQQQAFPSDQTLWLKKAILPMRIPELYEFLTQRGIFTIDDFLNTKGTLLAEAWSIKRGISAEIALDFIGAARLTVRQFKAKMMK